MAEQAETFTIRRRVLLEINTDPQRRCYYGVHAKSELVWSAWGELEIGVPAERVDRRLEFWRELNDYAVSQRGKADTKAEFEAVPESVATTEQIEAY